MPLGLWVFWDSSEHTCTPRVRQKVGKSNASIKIKNQSWLFPHQKVWLEKNWRFLSKCLKVNLSWHCVVCIAKLCSQVHLINQRLLTICVCDLLCKCVCGFDYFLVVMLCTLLCVGRGERLMRRQKYHLLVVDKHHDYQRPVKAERRREHNISGADGKITFVRLILGTHSSPPENGRKTDQTRTNPHQSDQGFGLAIAHASWITDRIGYGPISIDADHTQT